MDSPMERKQLLPKIVSLAEEAGQAIMTIYNREDLGITYKDDASPLTEADLAAHNLILSGLSKLTPDWPALSEESQSVSYDIRKDWNRYWLIDPLDGTKEFVKRSKEFTVNIALIENGVPVMGVVYAPALDHCYYASQGEGAFKKEGNHTAYAISAKPQGHQAMQIAVSRSHIGQTTMDFLEKIGTHELLRMGSSLKLCLVAEGVADLYPRLGRTMEWDIAAAQSVVVEAGGSVTDPQGQALQYNKADLANPNFFVRGNPPVSLPADVSLLEKR